MSVTFTSANYGYTDNGNIYKKSKIGKKIGTVAGIAALYPLGNLGFKVASKKGFSQITSMPDYFKKLVNFVKKGPEFNESLLAQVKFGPRMEKVMNLLSKSKASRIGVVGLAMTLPVVTYALAGRLVGHIADKIVDHRSKKLADM